mmetsp:Transcript_85689/g.239467  ORF Transcript_85689/g.239467 Transcript_85689/m.239467 type:complete len:220 (+) Transcript_85689:613-1272(+)
MVPTAAAADAAMLLLPPAGCVAPTAATADAATLPLPTACVAPAAEVAMVAALAPPAIGVAPATLAAAAAAAPVPNPTLARQPRDCSAEVPPYAGIVAVSATSPRSGGRSSFGGNTRVRIDRRAGESDGSTEWSRTGMPSIGELCRAAALGVPMGAATVAAVAAVAASLCAGACATGAGPVAAWPKESGMVAARTRCRTAGALERSELLCTRTPHGTSCG